MPFSPHDAAIHAIGRADNLLAISAPGQGLPADTARDVWRMALVMAVAALDTYMHRLIVGRAYDHAELPGKLARLTFGFEQMLERTDHSAAAARLPPHNSRPRVALKRMLRDRLLRETFQSYSDVSSALGMAGLAGNWIEIGAALAPPLQPLQIKERLDTIVLRRNQIVHEGDYVRLDRPQDAARNPVAYGEIQDDVVWLGSLIDAIDAVV